MTHLIERVHRNAVEVEESLVDRIYLNGRGQPPQQVMHLPRLAGDRIIIVGENRNMVCAPMISRILNNGASMAMPSAFACLVAAGHGTAIIIAKHNHGLALQVGTQSPLAMTQKVVAIRQSNS